MNFVEGLYEYKRIIAHISQGAIRDLNHMGIDIVKLASHAIDKMRYVSGENDTFQVVLNCLNPNCEPDECRFEIRIYRKQ
jgi:hypothetical protein